MKTVRQHRLVIWGRDVTGWRFDADLVRDIAIERGVASFDPSIGPNGTYFWNIRCGIQTREVEAVKVIKKLPARRAA